MHWPFPALSPSHRPGVAAGVLRDIFEVSTHDILKAKTLESRLLVKG